MTGGMTGIDLAHEAGRRRPELKVLFTSGYAEPAAVKVGMLTTNVSWLGKPYNINELDAKLRWQKEPAAAEMTSAAAPAKYREVTR